jgi:hypothetical protein
VEAAYAEMRLWMGFMVWQDGGDGLDLQDYLLGDYDVCLESVGDRDGFVDHRKGDLLFEGNARLAQFVAESLSLRRFEKAGTDASMHLDRWPDHPFGQLPGNRRRHDSCGPRWPSVFSPW